MRHDLFCAWFTRWFLDMTQLVVFASLCCIGMFRLHLAFHSIFAICRKKHACWTFGKIIASLIALKSEGTFFSANHIYEIAFTLMHYTYTYFISLCSFVLSHSIWHCLWRERENAGLFVSKVSESGREWEKASNEEREKEIEGKILATNAAKKRKNTHTYQINVILIYVRRWHSIWLTVCAAWILYWTP